MSCNALTPNRTVAKRETTYWGKNNTTPIKTTRLSRPNQPPQATRHENIQTIERRRGTEKTNTASKTKTDNNKRDICQWRLSLDNFGNLLNAQMWHCNLLIELLLAIYYMDSKTSTVNTTNTVRETPESTILSAPLQLIFVDPTVVSPDDIATQVFPSPVPVPVPTNPPAEHVEVLYTDPTNCPLLQAILADWIPPRLLIGKHVPSTGSLEVPAAVPGQPAALHHDAVPAMTRPEETRTRQESINKTLEVMAHTTG